MQTLTQKQTIFPTHQQNYFFLQPCLTVNVHMFTCSGAGVNKSVQCEATKLIGRGGTTEAWRTYWRSILSMMKGRKLTTLLGPLAGLPTTENES